MLNLALNASSFEYDGSLFVSTIIVLVWSVFPVCFDVLGFLRIFLAVFGMCLIFR